ncbi:hypothetical protein [Stieleria neptunia]|nr:hypothetical protein [Stieleria neptunia]
MPKAIRRRKPFKTVLKFWTVNLIAAPILFTLCLSVAAQGIRELVSVMQTRLYRLPFPGAEMLRDYQGFERLDLSHLASALLFLAVTFIWMRVIEEAKGLGPVSQYLQSHPIAFWIYATIAAVIIVVDGVVFYFGLAARSNAWTETSIYVPIGCTLLYVAGTAAFAAFHQDYHQSDQI